MMISVSMESVRTAYCMLMEEPSSEPLSYFLIIPILFATLIILLLAIPFLHKKYFPKGTHFTREHLIIGRDAILWSDIEHIGVKKSEWGNPYLVLSFKDKRSPKSYDIEYFTHAGDFVSILKERAAEKGITFSTGRHIELNGEVPPQSGTFRELKNGCQEPRRS